MLNIILYFQVHQPSRLSRYRVLDIGGSGNYFDDELNGRIINKVSEKCYLRTNQLLLKLAKRYKGLFRFAFSITGSFIEQLQQFRPDVLESFKNLAETGSVEFLGETYYHSLAFMFDEDEFVEQVQMHSKLMETLFGYSPVTFRNTELIYCDRISDILLRLQQFRAILSEGAERVLGWRSPLYLYRSFNRGHHLLLKYYNLSDDIAFRFSDKGWVGYPLTVDMFVDWVGRLGFIEQNGRDLYVNLFMDYETFGEHQWDDTGIFEFIEHLPEAAFRNGHIRFIWPREAVETLDYEAEVLSVKDPVSWADTERDMSAWMSNSLQHNALSHYYDLLRKVKAGGRNDLITLTRKLSTSDLYYYMCTKYFSDGDVHKYFSPYSSPEEAYIYFVNVLADLEKRVEEGVCL